MCNTLRTQSLIYLPHSSYSPTNFSTQTDRPIIPVTRRAAGPTYPLLWLIERKWLGGKLAFKVRSRSATRTTGSSMSWLGKINPTEMGNRAAIGATQSISQVFLAKTASLKIMRNVRHCLIWKCQKVYFECLGLDYEHLKSLKKEEEKSGKYF